MAWVRDWASDRRLGLLPKRLMVSANVSAWPISEFIVYEIRSERLGFGWWWRTRAHKENAHACMHAPMAVRPLA